MKKLILLLFITLLVACGSVTYEESGISENEDYSTFEKVKDGNIEFRIPEGFKLEDSFEGRSVMRSYQISKKPISPTLVYITVDKLDSVEAAQTAVASRHKEFEDHEQIKKTIEAELFEYGYKRIVTSNLKQHRYLIGDKDLHNTTVIIETYPDKFAYSFYFFNMGSEFIQARLMSFERDFKRDDLNLRRIIDTIKISE
ncbi:MAG: hypothetical protein GX219_00400 [Tissierellia bacterium]|nr:hypothetical protein [Tissierellia bacterium]